jgi:hypothetical protein
LIPTVGTLVKETERDSNTLDSLAGTSEGFALSAIVSTKDAMGSIYVLFIASGSPMLKKEIAWQNVTSTRLS